MTFSHQNEHDFLDTTYIISILIFLLQFWKIYLFIFKLQDVAVKVLTVQDFQDDQLKEFLREVCIQETNVLKCLFIAVVYDLDYFNQVWCVSNMLLRHAHSMIINYRHQEDAFILSCVVLRLCF